MYGWLLNSIDQEYAVIRVLKESPRGSVRMIRHKALGTRLILRRFQGSGEVYRQLMGYVCGNLPQIYETAEQDGEVLVLEEFIEGDTLGFLLEEALFSPRETREVVLQLCRALWVLHSMAAVHRDIKPDIYALGVLMNVMLTGEHPSKRLAGGRMGRVIERCTRVNPEKRYKDVIHLMSAL